MRDLEYIVEPVLAWYDNHKRILPWRENKSAYRVWVSEIMLQQTRVEAVKPFFERFITALPTLHDLAMASEDELLKLWEGLGYYNRVRNMQKAALNVIELYQGEMPDTYEQLLTLPGIGSYTAGAVASISFGRPVPAVDGNVLRILSRLTLDAEDILSAKAKNRVETELLEIIPKDRAGDFNQALMELGATVCVPNGEPHCIQCPWVTFCLAKREDKISEYPKKKKKNARVLEQKTIIVIRDSEKTVIRKRPSKGLLAGMYEFPTLEGHATKEQVLDFVKNMGYHPVQITELENSKHIFSHKEWHMLGYAVKVAPQGYIENKKNKMGFFLVEPQETEEKYPIPAAYLAYTKTVSIKIGNHKYHKD